MPEIRGEVDAIRGDGWEKGFKVNDLWFRKSKGYKGPAPQPGQSYVVTYNESDYNGRTYYWAEGVKLISNGAEPGQISPRDASIMKQVALKAAVELAICDANHMETQTPLMWEGVTLRAQRLYDWLMEQEPAEDEPPEPEYTEGGA